ncbi:MAG: hypothetical protein U1E46_09605 [Hyphomicrobiales bacterium]
MKNLKLAVLAASMTLASLSNANAGVIQVDASAFVAGAGQITFSELPFGTVNPTYTPADYGGDPTSPSVFTGGFFVGQNLSGNPGVDCPGAAATACVVGSPTGPLTLDGASPNTFITNDGSNPTSPVLSGSPTFNGPIALLFSEDQYGVGFDAGFFNAVGSTGITAFDRQGNLLGTVVNSITGIQFLGLVTDNGLASIAGVFLDLVGDEPAGFAIDNVRFGVVGQVLPDIPVPAALPLFLTGLTFLGAASRKKAKQAA